MKIRALETGLLLEVRRVDRQS